MTTAAPLLVEFVARYPAQPATAYWRAIEIEMLANAGIPDGLGLDLGCGDGILTDILAKRMGRRLDLVGVDIDPLETAAARAFDFYARVHACPGDRIPEPDATFDFAISNSVLEHIPDLEPVIAEVSRLLKPGGRFFFTVPGTTFHENLRGGLNPGQPREDYLRSLDRRLAHFHYLSADSWNDLCSRNGMKVDEAREYLDKAETRRWETLSRMTGGLLYHLFGGADRPIEIQRSLHLRAIQNASKLPRPIAASLAKLISMRLEQDRGEHASCLLVTGRKVCAS